MSLSLTAGQLGRDKSPAAAGDGRVTRRAGPKREAPCGSNVLRALVVNVGVSCGWTARWRIFVGFLSFRRRRSWRGVGLVVGVGRPFADTGPIGGRGSRYHGRRSRECVSLLDRGMRGTAAD